MHHTRTMHLDRHAHAHTHTHTDSYRSMRSSSSLPCSLLAAAASYNAGANWPPTYAWQKPPVFVHVCRRKSNTFGMRGSPCAPRPCAARICASPSLPGRNGTNLSVGSLTSVMLLARPRGNARREVTQGGQRDWLHAASSRLLCLSVYLSVLIKGQPLGRQTGFVYRLCSDLLFSRFIRAQHLTSTSPSQADRS